MDLIEKYLTEKNDYEFVIMQLKNDEFSSDKEMVDHLSNQTKFDKKKIEKLVKNVRGEFLKNTLMDTTKSLKLVKKYI